MNSPWYIPPKHQQLCDDSSRLVIQQGRRLDIVGTEQHTVATEDDRDDQHARRYTKYEAATAREKHRLSQQRYRKKQYHLVPKLENETCRLPDEIDKLKRTRRAVLSRAPATATVWKVAVEYFGIFRHGLQTGTLASCVQLDFVQATMAPDVMHNSGCGAEVMMRSWRRFSAPFEDVELEFERLERSVDGSIIATTTTSFTINELTLQKVFPLLHRMDGDNHKGSFRLTQKLLGQRIVMHGATCFEWDSAFERVTSVRGRSDFLTPIFRLLGNLEDVSKVFENSLVRPDFQ